MSQKGDQSSQLSGFSGVSVIRSSSPQPHDVTQPSKHGDTERLLNDVAECEETITEAARVQLIQECLQEVANDGGLLPPETSSKLRQIIQAQSVYKYLKVAVDIGDGIQTQLLGITDVSKPELNTDERKMVKAEVERKIRDKCQKFITKYEKLGGNIKEAMDTNKSCARLDLSRMNESLLSDWKEKIGEVCNEYQRDVVKLAELLEDWKKLKYDDVEEINTKKAETKLLQSQIAEIQARLTKISCTIKMFKETPTTITAFKTISHELDEKIAHVEGEIKRKKLLKKQYEDLQGTEYDEVLKRYLDLCATIKKEERLLEML
ncbi:uncharacterized protein LOC107048633 [Diachasma alloeum]|uniref:uncharacterized protein LOC107048633 n=1 Tax=Diachasma alloeum TaxID=454923 RepID=UPI0007381E5E|nr:uncharacterized protein LOC107048633 [Diachasma alloeum]